MSCRVSPHHVFDTIDGSAFLGDGGGPIERGEMPSYEEEQEKEFFKVRLGVLSWDARIAAESPLCPIARGELVLNLEITLW